MLKQDWAESNIPGAKKSIVNVKLWTNWILYSVARGLKTFHRQSQREVLPK
jgi:hypothetical protein